MNRNLAVLFFAQMISVCASMVMVTIGGIVGTRLAPDAALATLPISLMVVGTAIATIPAALLMRRIGRRAGSALAALVGASGILLAALAIESGSFMLFCAGIAVFGLNLAFTQQYRFAAAESVRSDQVGGAISLVLLGSIGGALVGPLLVSHGRNWLNGSDYAGTLFALSALLVVAAALLTLLRNPVVATAATEHSDGRPLWTVVCQPHYLLALGGGVVAYGVMSFIMTATPVSMHVVDGHSMEHTAGVVRGHVIAMYAPSLVSGWLIGRLGSRIMMLTGSVVMLATVLIGLQGQAVMHYWFALVLLGIGWNFLYVGATTLLTRTYYPAERFRAQAINDFSVFGCSAAGSLLAGTVIHLLGWTMLLLVVIAPLLLMLLALIIVRAPPTPAPRAGVAR
ncbi:MAG: MFS transporter [Gammaproteobacteria bacterium]|nr:MFS transporter [Gammaproteobacteria bacterium]